MVCSQGLLSRGLQLPRVSEAMIHAEIASHAWMRGDLWGSGPHREAHGDVRRESSVFNGILLSEGD